MLRSKLPSASRARIRPRRRGAEIGRDQRLLDIVERRIVEPRRAEPREIADEAIGSAPEAAEQLVVPRDASVGQAVAISISLTGTMLREQPSVTTSGTGASDMADDLGARTTKSTQPPNVYWTSGSASRPTGIFAKDEALDREIAERFGVLRDRVFADRAASWRDEPDTLLAAIILLDQFSRNLHRGNAEAFAADNLAVSLTLHAIERGWEANYSPEQRAFLYMPLMHAEDVPLQTLSIEKFEALGNANNLKFARDHAAVIARFGRFPSRNAALSRASTAAETDYLSGPDAGW